MKYILRDILELLFTRVEDPMSRNFKRLMWCLIVLFAVFVVKLGIAILIIIN
jgi:hypothetical protein